MFNDLKAARFNPRKYRVNIVSEDLWKRWKQKTGRKESFQEFKKLWAMIAEGAIECVFEEQDGLRLPKGMGDVYLGYVPGIKKRGIDYKTSRELNKTILHENWNSNGKTGKIIFGITRRKYLFKRPSMWAFIPCRNFKRSAVKMLREYPERYKNSIEKRNGKR